MIEVLIGSARFNTSQRLADQTKMILKKAWFSDLKIPEIRRQVYSEEYEQDRLTKLETLNTKKQEPSNRIESQNTEN